jgi:molecular chaperone GrpE
MKKVDGPGSKAGDDKVKSEAGRAPADGVEVEVVDGEALPEEEELLEAAGAEEVETAIAGEGELAAQNAVLLDSLQRLKADFDNYRKRMIKEQTRILETAEADLVKKLLPVIDNLERAIMSAGESGAAGLAEGVGKVLELMLDTLQKEGLEVIDPEGEPFDPEHHEAMMVVETDQCPEDTVVDVIQKGYRFAGVLLRPAMVRVSCPVK